MFTHTNLQQFKVPSGKRVDLSKYPTDWLETKAAKKLGKSELKKRAERLLEKNRESLAEMQERVYANNTFSILIVLQAMDAAGKDGTIQHVMSGVNPQGCQVFSFKHPSSEELDHDFLWRYANNLPERGRIGIFNRSYYEDVLVLKVHPDRLNPWLPAGARDDAFWASRYESINGFERHLTSNGTVLLKFFLHLSKEEQRKRFLSRVTTPKKQWKYSSNDLAERSFWDAYQKAYTDALSATSTEYAPWWIIPADRKYVARAMVADIIVRTVGALGLDYPTVPKEEVAALKRARRELEAEGRQESTSAGRRRTHRKKSKS